MNLDALVYEIGKVTAWFLGYCKSPRTRMDERRRDWN